MEGDETEKGEDGGNGLTEGIEGEDIEEQRMIEQII